MTKTDQKAIDTTPETECMGQGRPKHEPFEFAEQCKCNDKSHQHNPLQEECQDEGCTCEQFERAKPAEQKPADRCGFCGHMHIVHIPRCNDCLNKYLPYRKEFCSQFIEPATSETKGVKDSDCVATSESTLGIPLSKHTPVNSESPAEAATEEEKNLMIEMYDLFPFKHQGGVVVPDYDEGVKPLRAFVQREVMRAEARKPASPDGLALEAAEKDMMKLCHENCELHQQQAVEKIHKTGCVQCKERPPAFCAWCVSKGNEETRQDEHDIWKKEMPKHDEEVTRKAVEKALKNRCRHPKEPPPELIECKDGSIACIECYDLGFNDGDVRNNITEIRQQAVEKAMENALNEIREKRKEMDYKSIEIKAKTKGKAGHAYDASSTLGYVEALYFAEMCILNARYPNAKKKAQSTRP